MCLFNFVFITYNRCHRSPSTVVSYKYLYAIEVGKYTNMYMYRINHADKILS